MKIFIAICAIFVTAGVMTLVAFQINPDLSKSVADLGKSSAQIDASRNYCQSLSAVQQSRTPFGQTPISTNNSDNPLGVDCSHY